MSKPKIIIIDEEKYVRECDVPKPVVVKFTGEHTVASLMIGKDVIVRSRNEGINAGTVVAADDTGVTLSDCRRIWYHEPKDKRVSWYEGVCNSGLSSNSKVSCTVKFKTIIEDYSMTVCDKDAFKSIMELNPNEQN